MLVGKSDDSNLVGFLAEAVLARFWVVDPRKSRLGHIELGGVGLVFACETGRRYRSGYYVAAEHGCEQDGGEWA